jgi:UDP-sulfoquinovose synthase
MRIVVLGGDGYLGWPTALSLSRRGDEVTIVDNFIKRAWERSVDVAPLVPLAPLEDRIRTWKRLTGLTIHSAIGDLTDYTFVDALIDSIRPDAIVHYGEQPSAPFSMLDARRAAETQANNVLGTLNVLFAIRDRSPESHLVKLGTMGEYGTPDIDIEEGYLTVSHNGRSHTFLYPKTPGSFYHLSKVHDSHNIHFTTRAWGLRATDLNQGVVYGVETDETALDPGLGTSFHYDEIFGTVLNRFCVQAVVGHPLTIYGAGGQTRGYLNIRDTVQCVTLAIDHPAAPGELRVFNQFTEQLSVLEVAEKVTRAARHLGWEVESSHVENPRFEAERHYYNARHEKLLELGLTPRLLSEELIDTMLLKIAESRDQVDASSFIRHVAWAPVAVPR